MAIRHFSDVDWQATSLVAIAMIACTGSIAFLASIRRKARIKSTSDDEGIARLNLIVDHGFFLLTWTILFLGALSAFFVFHAASQDNDGLYGQTGAAWIQAVGSILAIVAIAVLDHRSFRRLQMDRRDSEISASYRRIKAIKDSANAIRLFVNDASERFGEHGRIRLKGICTTRISGPYLYIGYLYRQNVELDFSVLNALSMAHEVFRGVIDSADSDTIISTNSRFNARMEFYTASANLLEHIHDEVFSYFIEKYGYIPII